MRASCMLLTALLAHAQAQAPSFEVVSIRAATVDPAKGITVGATGGPGSKDPTRFTAQNFNLPNLITVAYHLRHWQLKQPDWMRQDRSMFNMTATIAEGATREQFEIMMQRMLAERFHLKAHWETKEMAAYDLVVAKGGPKLTEAVTASAESANASAIPPGPLRRDPDGYPVLVPGRTGSAFMSGRARMQRFGATMDYLSDFLTGQLGGPVTDRTGLTGKYDIALYWSQETLRAGPPPPNPDGTPGIEYPPGPTLAEALRGQLGLNLERGKADIKVLVVDSCDKTPTEN